MLWRCKNCGRSGRDEELVINDATRCPACHLTTLEESAVTNTTADIFKEDHNKAYVSQTSFNFSKDAYLYVFAYNDDDPPRSLFVPFVLAHHPTRQRNVDLGVYVSDDLIISKITEWTAIRFYHYALALFRHYGPFQWLKWLHDAPAWDVWIEDERKNGRPEVAEALHQARLAISNAYDNLLTTIYSQGANNQPEGE